MGIAAFSRIQSTMHTYLLTYSGIAANTPAEQAADSTEAAAARDFKQICPRSRETFSFCFDAATPLKFEPILTHPDHYAYLRTYSLMAGL